MLRHSGERSPLHTPSASGVTARRRAGWSCAQLALIASFTACSRPGPSAPHAGDPPRLVAVITPPDSSPQTAAIRGGARQCAARYSTVRVEFFTPTDASEAAYTQSALEALRRNPRAVCLYVASPEVGTPVAQLLLNGGTMVVTMGTRSFDERAFGHVDANLTGGAEMLGEHLQTIAGEGRTYLLVHERDRSTLGTQCYDRFLLGSRHQYGMTLLDEEPAGDPSAARGVVAQLLDRFRNAALIVTLSPDAWLSNPLPLPWNSNTRFATMPAAPMLWPHLRAGRAAALVGPVDGEIGSLAIELAVQTLAPDVARGGTRVVPCELVTQRNLDEFAKRYAEAAGLPSAELLLPPASQPAGDAARGGG